MSDHLLHSAIQSALQRAEAGYQADVADINAWNQQLDSLAAELEKAQIELSEGVVVAGLARLQAVIKRLKGQTE